MMIKRIKEAVCDGITSVFGAIFTLFAAPVIHLSGMDNTDSGLTKEDLERSQRFAEELKRKRK